MLTKAACDQKYSQNSNIVRNYFNLNYCCLFAYILKCNLFLWCKAEFSASLLQSSASHDLSDIILKYWFGEMFLIINVEKTFAA